MNARILIVLAAALALAPAYGAPAANTSPVDYRDSIRSQIAFENPDFPNLKVLFYKPKRVTFGEKSQSRTAVQCLWRYTGPHGEIMLGVHKDLYLVDDGLIVKVLPTDHLTWVDGPPGKDDIDAEK